MIFIPGAVPSSKNSKQVFRRDGKTIVIWSKIALKYVRDSEEHWIRNKINFLELTTNVSLPLLVGFHFVRRTRHKYDFVNPLQTVQDLMKKYEWINDDNTDILIPFPLLINEVYSSYDKENPGVYIKLLNC